MDSQVELAGPPSPTGSKLPARGLRRPQLAFAGLGLAASGMIYHATAWGPWAFSDAAGYITAARNLLAGHGIGGFDPAGQFSPLTSHPPLYVLALGAVSLAGFEPLQSARILDVLLFGLLVALAGWMVARLLGSRGAGLALSSLLLLHPALLIAYTSAMADPLLVLLGLLSLLFLVESLRNPRRGSFLASALCAGGALLSRYPGAAFVLTGAAATLLWGVSTLAVRLRRAAAFGAIGGLPVGLFLLWSATLPGAEGPRALDGRLEILQGLRQFGRGVAEALWSWKPIPPAVLLPDWLSEEAASGLSGGLAVAGALAIALLLYSSLRRRYSSDQPAESRSAWLLIRVLGLFVVVYLAFFALAFLATDPTPDVDSRTLLPLLPALLGLVVGLALLRPGSWRASTALPVGWTALLLAALAGYAVISQDIVLGLHRTGLGYTSREWRASPTAQALRAIPPQRILVSNEPAAVLLLTGRMPYSIPEIAQRRSVSDFATYGSGTTEAELAFRQGRAWLVLFSSIHDQFGSLYGDRAAERLEAFTRGLSLVNETADGAIYAFPLQGR